jgi:hypothetical protein
MPKKTTDSKAALRTFMPYRLILPLATLTFNIQVD